MDSEEIQVDAEASTSYHGIANQQADALPQELPQTPFYSVEYPGYVAKESIPQAVHRLGGENALNSAFKRNASRKDALLELNLRPDNPFSHSIPGDVIGTNSILLKVVKKKYKHPKVDEDGNPILGAYVAQAEGILQKTARFRSMADYQFQPDPEDPLVRLRLALQNLDVEAIRDYRIPTESEDYYTTDGEAIKSNVRMFPPPLFGRQTVSQNYNYKPNSASIETTIVDDATGEEKKRLVNRQRWKGRAPTSVNFADPTPQHPPANALAEESNANQALLTRLTQLFETRPIWTRMALLNQFSTNEVRELNNNKFILPLRCYVFNDGPWRDTFVRLGYDPKIDKESRLYQRVAFRNVAHPVERASLIGRRQESRYEAHERVKEAADDAAPRRSHIFDGQVLTSESAAFQLCDVRDQMLRGMILQEGSVRETCHEKDGWYTSEALDSIKTVLRHKYFNLVEGTVVTDEECRALLVAPSTVVHTKSHGPRHGKHNMAKGALPPEEVTAARLRSVIGTSGSRV